MTRFDTGWSAAITCSLIRISHVLVLPTGEAALRHQACQPGQRIPSPRRLLSPCHPTPLSLPPHSCLAPASLIPGASPQTSHWSLCPSSALTSPAPASAVGAQDECLLPRRELGQPAPLASHPSPLRGSVLLAGRRRPCGQGRGRGAVPPRGEPPQPPSLPPLCNRGRCSRLQRPRRSGGRWGRHVGHVGGRQVPAPCGEQGGGQVGFGDLGQLFFVGITNSNKITLKKKKGGVEIT